MNNTERTQRNLYDELEQELHSLSIGMLEGFLIDCE